MENQRKPQNEHLPAWIAALLIQPELWHQETLGDYPFPVAAEYSGLRSLFEEGQIFAIMYQLKDLGEVLLKLPILCSAAFLLRDDVTMQLVKKPMSLGDWAAFGEELLKRSNGEFVYPLPQPLRSILNDSLDFYDESRFILLRNRFIGHGALGFDDNQDYRTYCETMLRAMSAHLERTRAQYRRLMIYLDADGLPCMELDGAVTPLSPFVVEMDGGLYLFDYLDGRKKAMPSYGLDYVTGGVHKSYEAPYFANVFARAHIAAYAAFTAEDAVSDREAEKALSDLHGESSFTAPAALTAWVRQNVTDTAQGGVYLLTMQQGMGKTAFVHALEKGIIRLDGVKVVAYHCSHSQLRGVNNFTGEVNALLRGRLVETVYGALPELSPHAENKPRNMLQVLRRFQALYQSRGEGDKLLLVLDGLDEIPALCREIFDFLPPSRQMPDNVYILLTARDPGRDSLTPFTVQSLRSLQTGSTLNLTPDSPENIAHLKKHLSSPDLCKTETGFRPFTEEEKEQLLRLSGGVFLNLSVYTRLTAAGHSVQQLPALMQEQLFAYYLSHLRSLYGNKLYREALRVLLLTATAREGLTLQEIAYLAGYPGITLRLLGFMKDFGALLSVRREVRGSIITIAAESYRQYAEKNFPHELHQMTEMLSQRFFGEEPEKYLAADGAESIPDGVLYLGSYLADYLTAYGDEELRLLAAQKQLDKKLTLLGCCVKSAERYRLERKLLCLCGAEMLRSPAAPGTAIDSLYLEQGITHNALGHYADALLAYDRALENWQQRIEQCDIQTRYRIALALTDRSELHSKTGQILQAEEDSTNALILLEKLQQQIALPDENPMVTALLNRAVVHIRNAMPEEAVTLLNRALETAQRLEASGCLVEKAAPCLILIDRAEAHRQLENYPAAIRDCDEAIQGMAQLQNSGIMTDESVLALAYLNRGACLCCTDENSAAIRDFDHALTLFSRCTERGQTFDHSNLALLHMNRAASCAALSQNENAFADYAAALSLLERLQAEGRQGLETLLALLFTKRCELSLQTGDARHALEDCTRAVPPLQTLVQNGSDGAEETLCNIYLQRAALYEALPDAHCALQDYLQAAIHLKSLQQQGAADIAPVLDEVYDRIAALAEQ